MDIKLTSGSTKPAGLDLDVFFLADGEKGQIGSLNSSMVASLIKKNQLKSKHNSVFATQTFDKLGHQTMAIIGLGKPAELTLEKVRLLGGTVIKTAKQQRCQSVSVDIKPLLILTLKAEDVMRAFTEGMILGNYDYFEYKTIDDEDLTDVTTVELVTGSDKGQSNLQSALDQAELDCTGVILTRNLVNCPPAHMHPAMLKKQAEEIAKASGGTITLKAHGREDLKKMGAGAILAVGQGSEFEPFLLHLEYKPAKAKKTVALVGKGVTFDSGGYSLKPSEHMEDMKFDMGGAAVVLGVFSVLAKLKPNVHIHGVMACVENMVSDRAMRLGDIIKTLNGQTIEVLNTDAEGRLILADALAYAQKYKPDMMCDFATLTGACMVALGDQVAAIMSDDEDLINSYENATKTSGEKLWRLPLTPEYDEMLKSPIADMRNITKSHYGGAITAALFLKRFVKEVPWAHFDIAGPVFTHTGLNSYTPVGATGFGVRTVLEWIKAI